MCLGVVTQKRARALSVFLHWTMIRPVFTSIFLATLSEGKVPRNFLANLSSSLRSLHSWRAQVIKHACKLSHKKDLIWRLHSWASTMVFVFVERNNIFTVHLSPIWDVTHAVGRLTASDGQLKSASPDTFVRSYRVHSITQITIVNMLQAVRPRNHGSIPGNNKRYFSVLNLPDRLQSARGLLFFAYLGGV